MQPVIVNGLAVLGALSGLFTTLHLAFPNVPLFQKLGMAFRSFGSKS